MEEVGGELNLFLPFKQSDFIDVSVRFAGEHWVERFNRIISRHSVTYLTQEAYEGHADLFHLQTSIIFGLSVLRSMGNHEEPTLISVLSERDRKRKTGGTRDTVAIWPFPKNHLSINPDVYVPEPVTITMDDAVPAAGASGRPVLFIVCCDLSSEQKLNNALMEELESGALSPVVLDIRENRMIAGFKTVFGALELCETATKIMSKPFQQKLLVRLSMHVGPLRINADEVRQKLSGDAIDIALRLHELSTPGVIHATGIVAAIVALEGKKYSFDYTDTLSTKGDAKALDVFKVHIHQLVPG
jgi:hypothetical protein